MYRALLIYIEQAVFYLTILILTSLYAAPLIVAAIGD
jgi:hypothetical protein